jgi:NhaA family Na+:H+ antiporter
MATDIAFSLGVASLLGSKFPVRLKVFLTALAIIDDLGAIVVIALFYGGAIKGLYLLGAGLVLALLYWMNKRQMRFGIAHVLLGLLLWYLVYNCGIHATIAGVLFAFMVPTPQIPRLEMKLHNVVNFLILPLFALANTAIVLNVSVMSELTDTLGLGIVAGLVLGKPIGIFLACWLLVRNRLASLPLGINWMQLAGAGLLAGIGFTMSIFIAGLAFDDLHYQDISKIAILVAAVLSVLLSFVWFQFSHRLPIDAVANPTPES